jgi:hypothetical protein
MTLPDHETPTTSTFKRSAKAWLASLGAAATYFIGVLDPTALGLSAFASVTTVQWLGAITGVLAVFGVTWAVPNRD